MPLLVSKVQPTLAYAATRDSFEYGLTAMHYPNKIVEDLMICCDPRLVDRGDGGAELLKTPRRWLEGVGSVIVVRKDGHSLYAHHVKVMLDFMEMVKSVKHRSLWLRADLPTLEDHPLHDCLLSETGRMIHSLRINSSYSTAEDMIAQFTPGDFKDYYMGERFYWKRDVEDSARLLTQPSPFNAQMKAFQIPKRNFIRRNYWKKSQAASMQNAKTWEERALLIEFHSLKQRLDKAEARLKEFGCSLYDDWTWPDDSSDDD